MPTELLLLRVALRDELSRPIRGTRREVERTTESMNRMAGPRMTRQIGGLRQEMGRLPATLSNIDNKAQGLSRSLTQMVGTGLRLSAIMGAIGVAGATAFGFHTAQQFQDIQVSMHAILGSAEEANALFGELQQINLRSPFELTDVAGMTNTLLRAGYEVENITEVVENFLAVAAGAGMRSSDLERVAFNLQQIAQTGFVSMMDIRQMAMAGMPIFDMIEEATGMTAEQMRRLGDEGRVSAEQFLSIFSEGGPIIEQYRGMLPTIMTTLSAQMSNFRDMLANVANEGMQPLLQRMQEFTGPAMNIAETFYSVLMPAITDVIVAFTEFAEPLTANLMPVLSTIINGIAGLLTAMMPALEGLGPVIDDLNSALEDVFTELAPLMPELVEAFVAFVAILPDVVRLLSLLIPLVTPIATLVAELLGFEPIAGMMAGLLAVLLGYNMLRGVIGPIIGMTRALYGLAGAQAAVAATSAAGGVGGARAGRGGWGPVVTGGRGMGMNRLAQGMNVVAGGSMLYGGMQAAEGIGRGDWGQLAASQGMGIAGGALTGATIGSIVPGIGTLIGAGIGAAVGSIATSISGIRSSGQPTVVGAEAANAQAEALRQANMAMAGTLAPPALPPGAGGGTTETHYHDYHLAPGAIVANEATDADQVVSIIEQQIPNWLGERETRR